MIAPVPSTPCHASWGVRVYNGFGLVIVDRVGR